MSTRNSTNRIIKIPAGKDRFEYLCLDRMIPCDEHGNPLKIGTVEICIPEKKKSQLYPVTDEKIDTSSLEDDEEIGYVYLLKNDELGILKIGYSFNIHDRMKDHLKRGFRSIEILMVSEKKAKVLEQFLISFIKCNWIPFGSILFTHRFDGWTECWKENHFRIYSFDQLRSCIIDFAVNCLPVGLEENV